MEIPADATLLRVTVFPGAKRASVIHTGARYHISVVAPAEDGRATEEAAILLAAYLSLPRRDLSLLSGATKPHKVFLLRTHKE